MMLLRTTAVLLSVFVDIVFTGCSIGCTSCQGQSCSSCQSSYFLSNGFCSKCPEDCNSCYSYDNCTTCKSKKFGLNARCSFDCTGACLNSVCEDDTGYCSKCNTGFYGLKCAHSCGLCVDDSCDLRKCSHGCREEYYEYTSSNESFCDKCPLDCRHCMDGKTCFACNDGFYLYKSGEIVGCVSCYQGSQCIDYCVIQGCNKCQIFNNSLICLDCSEGQIFNGVICESNMTSCSNKCSTYCDSNGICQGECIDGWTGERCSEKCFDRCLKCSKEDSNICKQCNGDFYLADCSLDCKPSCIKEDGKETCGFTDGYCLIGCKPNFWGETCNKSCPDECKDSICDKNTGICNNGCKVRYTGDKCIQATTRDQNEIPFTPTVTTVTALPGYAQFEGKSNNFIVGYFSGIGTSAVIVIFAVLLYLVRRRYIASNVSRDYSRDTGIPSYYNTTTNRNAVKVEPANVDTNYESLSSNRIYDKDYCDLGKTVL